MKKALPILFMLLLLGCGKSPKHQAEYETKTHLKEKILQFSATNKASFDWVKEISEWEDRVLTAHFQRTFLDPQESVFLFPLEISDLVRKDDGFVLVANANYFIYYGITLILKCPTEIAEKILNGEMGNKHDTFLVASKISSVRNVALELIPELNYPPEEVYVEAEWADIYIDVNVVDSHIVLVGECIALEKIGTFYFDFVELTIELTSHIEDNG